MIVKIVCKLFHRKRVSANIIAGAHSKKGYRASRIKTVYCIKDVIIPLQQAVLQRDYT